MGFFFIGRKEKFKSSCSLVPLNRELSLISQSGMLTANHEAV